MSSKFARVTNSGSETHFTAAPVASPEMSRMTATPSLITTMNAGDIVPIYCHEVLPNETRDFGIREAVIRQNTLMTPTMGTLSVDFYAFFVPNRIVNDSWKQVMGENENGSWVAPQVSLAPLFKMSPNASVTESSVQVPVNSVADYYGFPTQGSLPVPLLERCHDLKFRGYVMIYNERFRDQNYQPPIPMSTLNVYQGFFDSGFGVNSPNYVSFDGALSAPSNSGSLTFTSLPDGSFAKGALSASINEGVSSSASSTSGQGVRSMTVGGFYLNTSGSNGFGKRLNALYPPLKANKLHDYFTSVLPTPQKSASVFVPAVSANSSDIVRVMPRSDLPALYSGTGITALGLQMTTTGSPSGSITGSTVYNPVVETSPVSGFGVPVTVSMMNSDSTVPSNYSKFVPTNLGFNFEDLELGFSVDDLRMSVAVQQVYEQLARTGSRYREYVAGFFGLEVDDPFSDIPQYLGHFRRELDLYQTAQTSPSTDGGTPQGNLAAFGYTSTGGHLFTETFREHGYVHVFAVIRQKNSYSTYLSRDNFRQNFMDFFQPQLANISEQPVYTAEINPFAPQSRLFEPFGYQEAWSEYRFEPDYVTGSMRTGISGSLSVWNYADDYSSTLYSADGDWLVSNAASVVDRTLAVTSAVEPQFKAQFQFVVDKQLPMPTYSVPGLDVL